MNEFNLSFTRDELIYLKYAILNYRTCLTPYASSGLLDQLLSLSRKFDIVFDS